MSVIMPRFIGAARERSKPNAAPPSQSFFPTAYQPLISPAGLSRLVNDPFAMRSASHFDREHRFVGWSCSTGHQLNSTAAIEFKVDCLATLDDDRLVSVTFA